MRCNPVHNLHCYMAMPTNIHMRIAEQNLLTCRYGADVVIEDGTAACNANLDHDVVQQMMGACSCHSSKVSLPI